VETLTGRYRLIERIGAGGMSVVWRGYDDVLGRQVAVKVLAAQFATDADLRARLRREARSVARLSHPHVTSVYDYGEAPDGTPFVVMELVEGESLADRLERGPLPPGAVVELGSQIAGALAAAHARGLVHQDIKPANVMLCATGAKVVDFGIAAIAGERRGPMVVGTPDYMAPEQRAGAPATPATDVYALGLVLSRALRGGEPVPPALAALIADCVRESPNRRPSAAAVAQRLEAMRGAPLPGRARVPEPTRVLPTAVPAGSGGTRRMPVPPQQAPPPRASRWPLFAGVTVLLVIACVVGLALVNGERPGSSAAGASAGGASPAATKAPRRPSPSPTPRLVCRVDYQVTDYRIGFSAQVKVTNTGTADIRGWTLVFDLPDKQEFKGGVGGVWSQDGNRLTAKDWLVNATIKPGASVDLSLVGTSKGKPESPKSFTLNDVQCSGAQG
jgi:serine/threonine-protein kinase